MLNPLDKQNVALATETLLQFCESAKDLEKLKAASLRIADIAPELYLFRYVINGVLITYSAVSSSIQTQLEEISTASHILLIWQRKTFIPNQLYLCI